MQLSVTGHHVEVTAPLRSYVEKKLERLARHSDHHANAVRFRRRPILFWQFQ